MVVSRNIRDFTDLICECLSRGWQYTHGQPCETDLQHWAKLGRVMMLFAKHREDALALNYQYVHLVRCKDESLACAGYRRLCRVGLWNAYVEDRIILEPLEVDRPFELNWI